MTTTAAAHAAAATNAPSFYCSTSGTTFSDKEAYLEHMRSDFHHYNLKRKVAGLPPVTREWFESRKELLLASAAAATKPTGVQVWIDPLTKKKFMSENTYQTYVRSKKYLDMVKKSGQPAPQPVLITKPIEQPQQPQQPQQQAAGPAGKEQGTFAAYKQAKGIKGTIKEGDEEGEDGSDGGWETASDDGDAAVAEAVAQDAATAATAEAGEGQEEEGEWEEWDVCRCLFDNHISDSLDANLEYMYKNFGFYLPDSEYLTDPAGLIQYLGAKLQYGRVPLYTRGEDANAKQFRSLHAVQRHMVDTCQCRMTYEDNEDEYAQYYDYGPDEEEEQGRELAVNAPPTALVMGGYELMLPGEAGQPGKILGTREFARYYRQRHRLEDSRQSVVVNTVLARYRSLGVALTDGHKTLEAKKKTQMTAMDLRWEGKRDVRRLVFSNFVKQLGKGVGREY